MYTDKNNPYGGELSHGVNFIDSNSNVVDITRLVIEFNIYENIFNQTMSADFVIRDSFGLIDTPMTGQEFIQVLFDSKNKSLVGNYDNLTFKIYKASDKTEVTAGTSVYVLHCSSIELELNLTTDVTTTYRDKLGSEVVQHIFDNFVKEDNRKFIQVEECENVVPYTPVGHNPFEAINFIGKECRSAKYGDVSHFLFYETTRGFNFRTLSSLLEQEPEQDKSYYLGEPTAPDNRTRVERTVVGHTFLDTVDSIDLLMKGFYQNSVSAIDPITKTFSETSFNYANDFNELNHITDGGRPMLNLSASTVLAGNMKGSSHSRMVVADMAKLKGDNITFDGRLTPDNDPHVFHGRERYRKTPKVVTQLASLRQHGIDITVPVNLNINAGDIIQIYIPFTQDNEDNHLPFVGHYGSNPTFLVTSVATKFTVNGDYLTTLQCVKESFAVDLRGDPIQDIKGIVDGEIQKSIQYITQSYNDIPFGTDNTISKVIKSFI